MPDKTRIERRDQKVVSTLTYLAEKTPFDFEQGFANMVDALAFQGNINLADRKNILDILYRGKL